MAGLLVGAEVGPIPHDVAAESTTKTTPSDVAAESTTKTTPSVERRSRLSLRTQLLLAFGGISIVLLAALGVELLSLLRMRDQILELIVHQRQSSIASEIAVQTLLCRHYERDMLLNLHNPATRSIYRGSWSAAYTRLEAAIESFGAAASSDDDRRQYQQWKQQSNEYRTAVLGLEAAIVVGQLRSAEEANQALTDQKDSIQTLTTTALDVSTRKESLARSTNTTLNGVLDMTVRLSLMLAAVAAAIAILWSLLFPGRFLRPIGELRRTITRIAAGDLSTRASVASTDELGDLAGSFNQMADTIQQQLVALDQSAVVREQNDQLRKLLDLVQTLEMPVIPLLDGVLLIPLVGQIDTRRVRQISETVLDHVHRQSARVVIIDTTGMGTIDPQIAQSIRELTNAIQMLGARVMLTGLSAPAALALANMEASFQHIEIARQLRDGVAIVLGRARK